MTKTTLVALYDERDDAAKTVTTLTRADIPREEISLVGPNTEGSQEESSLDKEMAKKGASAGGVGGGLAGLLVGLVGLIVPGVGGAIVGGPLVGILVGGGAGATAGGLVGALHRLGVPEDRAHAYSESVRRGATLVAVSVPKDRLDEIRRLLRSTNPIDIERREKEWRHQGWERFDSQAKPLQKAHR